MKFKVGDHVLHVKTARHYVITQEPSMWRRLEATDQPFYAYEKDGVTWYRSEVEVEDGRFALITESQVAR